ncbi:hypothetical protein GSI_10167 [Ganoderma sinense ZZ0214-1]|uniref:Uncharacterized protein n=1 Tax=Ganoderma sinense ZZ0214-1 TaxID=1077348 RepID=A0A2G8S0E9_9APHY|nr:hypothetical protein GSI_10167 [Ganoderma sinense ZZ0214-1]
MGLVRWTPERTPPVHLQVGDLALPEGTLAEEHKLDAVTRTDQRLLADDDKVALSQLAPEQVQGWCLSRIARYRNYNRLLREGYGGAARNVISKNKSHIRALHTAYNDAAPIHRHFPPEVLIEVFSHVDPVVTVMRRLQIPRATIPLFSGLEPSPTPHAELHVEFVNTNGGTVVHWETRGDNVRPVRVTVADGSASCADIVSNLTRALVAALAPARGLTTFTVGQWHTQIERYWDDLWPVLGARLRRLQILEYTRLGEFVQQLQLPRPVRTEGTGIPTCVCPVLEVLALKWVLPPRLDYGLDGDWRVLRDRDDGRHLGHRAVGLLPSLREFCDMLRACLSTRAAGGCSPLRRIEVTVYPRWVDRDAVGDHVVLQGWQIALVGERMRDKLGDLVADIAVTGGLW